MEKKLTKRLWFNILLFNFMGGVAWNVENMYFNTFLYNSVYAGASAEAIAGTMSPTTAISRMVALSAITAVLTTFIMGTLSDKMKKRKVFISVGYIAWGIVTGLFGFISRDTIASITGLTDAAGVLTATVWAVIVMDMLMTFMGSTSNDSAFNAWVTDVTTPASRPKVETAFTFIGFLAMGAVMGVGTLAQAGTITYKAFFIILGVVVTLCGVVGLFLLEDPEIKTKEPEKKSTYWSDLFFGFRPSVVVKNSRLYLTLASVCLFNVAFQVFFPYLFVYLQYVILPANEGLNFLSAGVLIPAVLAVAALVAGVVILMKLSGKNKAYGFIPAVICMVIGLGVLSTTKNIVGVLIGVAPTVVGYLVLTIQLNAAIRDFIPVGKAGLFQGIRMIFVVLIPMVVGPFVGDIACRSSNITYINEYGVETIVPAASMFLYSAIIALLVFIPLGILIKKGFKVEENND
ncbi:MAG: MFS transporter [Clostridia bacterium]|nr:MFS transporter [Clostridia bacterium]